MKASNIVLQSISYIGSFSCLFFIGSGVSMIGLTFALFTLSPFLDDSRELQIALAVRKIAVAFGWSFVGSVGAGITYLSLKEVMKPQEAVEAKFEELPKHPCHGCKFYNPHTQAAVYLTHPCAVHPMGLPADGCLDYEGSCER